MKDDAMIANATDDEAVIYARGYFDCLYDLGLAGPEAILHVRDLIATGKTLPILKRGLDHAALERFREMPAATVALN